MANGLIDLQTDLTSLKYSTTPLGSDAPLITKNIGEAPGSQIGLEIQTRIDDTSRIAQMLISKPGIKYLIHEAQLQQINAGQKINKARKGGKTLVGAVLQQIGKTVVGTLKIAASTLAQIPVNGTGTHFIKGFRTDTYLQPTNGNNFSAFASFFGAGGIEGAQYALRGEIVPGTVGSDNQNFGETSTITGKFNPTPSLYDYNAKVNTDNNEIQNTPIPEWASKEFYNSTLASRGKVIPVSKAEIKPVQATNADTGEATTLPGFNTPFQQASKVETTATPGVDTFQSSIKSRSNKVAPEDFISPDSITNLPSETYSYNNTYTGHSASISILNAQSGNEIPVVSSSGDPGRDRLNDSVQKYSELSTYTGGSTDKIIDKVLKGKKISTHSGEKFTESYLRSNSDNATDGNSQIIVENLQDEKGEDIYQPGVTKGEISIPKLVSLSKLRFQINTGSITPVFRDGGTTTYTPILQDFRGGSKLTYSFDYNATTVNKEKRVGLGNQGAPSPKMKYTYVDKDKTDKLNEQDISNSRIDGLNPNDVRDLAKFFFEIITPSESKFLYFRAFIDSIDDSYNANWESHKYVGRAEDFYTYGGFSRDINVSFKIAAATRSEMKPLYRKMVYLASATAPTYGGEGFMRGTLARLTVGSYFDQIPGVITSVKYSLIDDMPWEIAMQQPEGNESGVQELPMGLQCSISFKPIHDFAPQTGLKHYFTSNEEAKNYLG